VISQSTIVIVDVETSGDDPFVHELTSIALLPLDRRIEPLHVRVEAPRAEWSSTARTYYEAQLSFFESIQQPEVSARRAFNEISRYLTALTCGSGSAKLILAGHNVGFDIAFMRKLCFSVGEPFFDSVSHRLVDTHSLLFALHIGGSIPSTALTSSGAFAWFGVAEPRERRHTALGDALATRDLLHRLIDIFQSTGQFEWGSVDHSDAPAH
jgi:DNA polymerase-3 subunit epsilon